MINLSDLPYLEARLDYVQAQRDELYRAGAPADAFDTLNRERDALVEQIVAVRGSLNDVYFGVVNY